MKNILLAAGIIFISTTAFAQTKSLQVLAVTEEPQNEVGVFTHNTISNTSANNRNVNMLGIQYSHWKNERVGYRIMAGYGNHYSAGDIFRKTVNIDTFIDMRTRRVADLVKVGAAAQIQRKFYKRVYLFAAVELNVGYGKGKQDTLVDKTYMTSNYTYENSGDYFGRPASDLTMWHASLLPSVGAKLVFKRITAGVEFFGINATYSTMKVNNKSNGLFDFDMGNLAQRFFLHYRFK